MRIDEQTDERRRFRPVILPPWCRKSVKVAEVLSLLGGYQVQFEPADRALLAALLRPLPQPKPRSLRLPPPRSSTWPAARSDPRARCSTSDGAGRILRPGATGSVG